MFSVSDEAEDELVGGRGARRKRWVVVPTGREVDLRVGGGTWISEDVGEPQGPVAEPTAQHRDVATAEIDDAAFSDDDTCPRQVDSVVLRGDRLPVRHKMP